MVGHTFLYNPAVRHLKKVMEGDEFGQLRYMYSQRLNLGQVRKDVNVWWNFAPHDISIFLYLMKGMPPKTISARGASYLQPGIEDVVFATIAWETGVVAHIHVSWLNPRKSRTMTFVASRKMIIYDDMSVEKLAIFDKGVDPIPMVGERMDFDNPHALNFHHRVGDVWLPRIEPEEPLKVEANHFLDCIENDEQPLTGPQHARDVVAILEAGDRALKNGTIVKIQ